MITVTVLLLLVAIIFLYTKRKFKYWENRGVASLNPLTPGGDFLLSFIWWKNEQYLLKDHHKAFKSKGLKYGGLYYTLGPIFVPVDPDIIKRVLQTDFQYFTDRGMYHNKQEQVLSEHLFSMTGEKWKSLRAKLTPNFTTVKLKAMYAVVAKISDDLVKVIKERDGAAVNTLDFFRRYNIDIIASCFYEIEEHNIRNKHSVFLDMAKKIVKCSTMDLLKVAFSEGTKNPGNMLKLLYMDGSIYDFFKKLVCDIVDKQVKNKEEKRSGFIESLLEIMNEEKSELDPLNPFDFDDVVSQVVLFFTGGFETTALLLTCCLYELGKHPDIQEKLRKEIAKVLKENNDEVSFSMLGDLKYLQQVIEETLRLHTVVPTLHRICVKDYIIPGTNVTIEKGTPVMISALALHHDPDNFPNPETFDPNRFADDNTNKPFYLAFGGGPRYCIAKRFSEIAAKRTIVGILSNFRVTVNEKTGPRLIPEDVAQHVVAQFKNDIWINFEQIC